MSGSIKMNDAAQLMQFDINKKSMTTAYLLWGVVGGVGGHRFYLRDRSGGSLLAACSLLSLTGDWRAYLGIISGIMLFIDLFTIPSTVRKHNEALIARLSSSTVPATIETTAAPIV